MEFSRNNLDKAVSPYLKQHKDNPIWWQEWSKDVLDYARAQNKIIFASVGYSTCHWCHVMASEAFEDPAVADYLNKYFVSIKVDREQRPDIDSYLMSFITSFGGQGGWPLNCFLTGYLKPIYAMTYAPVDSGRGVIGFLEILQRIKEYYEQGHEKIEPFTPSVMEPVETLEQTFLETLWSAFDQQYAGFGEGMKFPPHCTLLFLLYAYEVFEHQRIKVMIEKTLDAMLLRGLHDHLQGGFFRYSVDREWTIPHFEKMLYDQAMLLWVYSLAYGVFGKKAYRAAVLKLLECLDKTFEEDGLYYSGHDADTNHEEGATYLWTEEDLRRILTPEEQKKFGNVYAVSPEGNFEGKNHLLKKRLVFERRIDEKLLDERRKRDQPFCDKKIITSWNCLLGIALVHAYRYAGSRKAMEKAEKLFGRLMERHYSDGKLAHSSCDGQVQPGEFLQDYAAMLLFVTYLHEDTGRFQNEIEEFSRKVLSFEEEGVWIESRNEDFLPVAAGSFDQPTPSSVGLAEFGLLRADIFLGRDYEARPYQVPLNSDFINIAGLMANGLFHMIETTKKLEWDALPVNSLQKKGDHVQDCYNGSCYELSQIGE